MIAFLHIPEEARKHLAMVHSSVSKNGRFFYPWEKHYDNLGGGKIDLIIAEEGDQASGYFGGHF